MTTLMSNNNNSLHPNSNFINHYLVEESNGIVLTPSPNTISSSSFIDSPYRTSSSMSTNSSVPVKYYSNQNQNQNQNQGQGQGQIPTPPHSQLIHCQPSSIAPPPPPPPPQQILPLPNYHYQLQQQQPIYYPQPIQYAHQQQQPIYVPAYNNKNNNYNPSDQAHFFNQQRYSPIRRKSKQSTTWSPKEDKLLRELKEIQKLGWREISTFFHDRTPNACQFRWRRIISSENAAKEIINNDKVEEMYQEQQEKEQEQQQEQEHDLEQDHQKKQHSITFLLN
ncbi:unnamed protein product [Candida verbasci]|uniref:Myb-like domain-containing protein n=1 Tax=Candida verbasci TaxID=1227364 RepID=A0A9W4XJN7_9ASCO|nr:unnamed protein product [Candida verbasci]